MRGESGWYQPAYGTAFAGSGATGGNGGFCSSHVTYVRMALPIFQNASPFPELMP